MNKRIATTALAIILFAAACGDDPENLTVSAGNDPVSTQDDTVSTQNDTDSDSPDGISLGVPANVTDFDGMSKDEAIAKAEDENREWRIGSEDGELFALTEDFHPGRVTFDILNGVIVHSFIEVQVTDSEMVVEPEDGAAQIDNATSDFANSLIGMSTDEAIAIVEEAGRAWRISSEDGEDFILTMDYSEDRVNFAIVDGTVVNATTG